jgi:predicted kinase
MSAHLPPLITALLAGCGFPPAAIGRVELVETHASWVLLADKQAFKIKKPVTLPFLDYGTLERREACCRAELALNRRLAPELVPRRGADRWQRRELPPCDRCTAGHRMGGAHAALRRSRAAGPCRRARVNCGRQQLGSAGDGPGEPSISPRRPPPPPAAASARRHRCIAAARENFVELRTRCCRPRDQPAVEALAVVDRNRVRAPYASWLRPARKAQRLHPRGPRRPAPGQPGAVRRPGARPSTASSSATTSAGTTRSANLPSSGSTCSTTAQPGLAAWLLNAWLEAERRLRRHAAAALLRRVSRRGARQDRRPARTARRTRPSLPCRNSTPRAATWRWRATSPLPTRDGGIPGTPIARRCRRWRSPAALSGSGKTDGQFSARLSGSGGVPGAGRLIRLRSDVERKRLFGVAPLASQRFGPRCGGIYTRRGEHVRTYARLLDLAREHCCGAGWPVIVDAAFLRRAERDAFRATGRRTRRRLRNRVLLGATAAELRQPRRVRAAATPRRPPLEVLDTAAVGWFEAPADAELELLRSR